MASKLKKIFSNLSILKKDQSSSIINYKYDNIIQSEIQKKTFKNQKMKYKIGKFEVKRKIPDKNELDKIYNNFLKDKNIIIKKDILFKYNYYLKTIKLDYDKQYFHLNLNLNKDKLYNLAFSFDNINKYQICILFLDNHYFKRFDSTILEGSVDFKTNTLYYTQNLEFYIIFKTLKPVILNNLKINIHEHKNVNDYNISLLKNNDRITIF